MNERAITIQQADRCLYYLPEFSLVGPGLTSLGTSTILENADVTDARRLRPAPESPPGPEVSAESHAWDLLFLASTIHSRPTGKLKSDGAIRAPSSQTDRSLSPRRKTTSTLLTLGESDACAALVSIPTVSGIGSLFLDKVGIGNAFQMDLTSSGGVPGIATAVLLRSRSSNHGRRM
ncbi:hypothetical protein VTG60DRAFT_2920 [Thermothelomyces hinnuleus]